MRRDRKAGAKCSKLTQKLLPWPNATALLAWTPLVGGLSTSTCWSGAPGSSPKEVGRLCAGKASTRRGQEVAAPSLDAGRHVALKQGHK